MQDLMALKGDGHWWEGEFSMIRNESHVRSLLEHIPAGAYMCDPEGLITYFNQQAVQLWGRVPKSNDPVDRYCGSFKLYAADGSPINHDSCWMALALRNEQDYIGREIIVERPDGNRYTVLAHASPFYDEEGHLLGAVNILVDITARKRVERENQEKEEQFRAAMEGSLNAFFVLRAERDGLGEIVDFVFLELNTRGEELIGIPRTRAIGGRLLELLPANRDMGFFDKYRRVVETREPLVEEFGECAAGHVGAWFWQQVVPLGDGIAITTADFTERKRTEIETEERFRQLTLVHNLSTQVTRANSIEEIYDTALDAILEATHADRAAVLLFDPDGVIRFKAWRGLSEVYRAAVEGHSPWRPDEREAASITIPDVETDHSLGRYREVVLREGIHALAFVPLAYEHRLLGKFMVYSNRPRPFTEPQLQLAQTITNHIAFAIERRRSEEALSTSERKYRVLSETLEQRVVERTRELAHANDLLAQRNRELQDYAYVASHDLQEPLRKIRTFLDLLRTELDEPSDSLLDYIRRMDASAERMSELITALLALSQVATRGERFRPTDLGLVVREVLSDLELNITETGAEVEVGSMCTVQADPMQMRQLFQNLIGNALKFRKPDVPPRLRIHSDLENQESDGVPICRVIVEDNGIGFDEKYTDRILKPFQRLHGRGKYPGAGMGLAICKRIAERHGGTILVQSTPGRGSTFTVTFPSVQRSDLGMLGYAA